MAHNLKGRGSAMLETFSGLITLAQPTDLTEGGSPRTQNTDFSVGSVFTRQGLENPFTYDSGSVGPDGGGAAVDTSTGGTPWSNVGNVLLNTGVYASNALTVSNQSPTPTLDTGNWIDIDNALGNTLYAGVSSTQFPDNYLEATCSGSIPSNSVVLGISVEFLAFGYEGNNQPITGFITAGSQTSQGKQSGNLDPYEVVNSFAIGGTRDTWGLSLTPDIINTGFSVYLSAAAIPTNQYAGAGLNYLVITVYYQSTDAIDITLFGFSTPATYTPQGFIVDVKSYVTATSTPVYLNVQMLKAGVPVGNVESLLMSGSPTVLSLGGINDLFGETWSYSDLNSTDFGVRITVSASNPANAFVGYVTITSYSTPTQVNYTYVTTYEDDYGNIKTLAQDGDGNWWVEDVTNTPNVLSPLFTGPPAGSYASSFTASSRQYIALSDGASGNYPPQQVKGATLDETGWNDRVSQVGPGAPPSFTGTLASSSNISITAYSYSAGILTLTAANTLTSGEVVRILATNGDDLFPLNNLLFNVLGTGLSSTQFEISTSLVTGSGTSTATAASQYTYPIVSSPFGITQYPFWNDAQGYQSQLDDILWSAGPGSTDAGNVITIFYLDATHHPNGQDINLVNAVQQGKFPVYVYVSGTNLAVANGTQLVTGVGIAYPPGAGTGRYYFTFNVASSDYQNLGGGGNAQPGKYQLTIATVNTVLPLPGVQVGDTVTISGDPIPSWDETWTVLDSLNSGAYAISQTVMTSGVATYNWALSAGTTTPPVAGDLVTVTGTLNGNGVFNVTDAIIASSTAFEAAVDTSGTSVLWISGNKFTGLVSGNTIVISGVPYIVTGTPTPTNLSITTSAGSQTGVTALWGTLASGTFTVSGFANQTFGTEAEDGQATTSGNTFQIDPGPLTIGSSGANPIYGNSGGGYITLVGSSSVVVSPGTRRGTVFFITRNGYWTQCAPTVTFTINENTNYILVANIPIGPPNVVARGIVLTEAGQEGIAGASYYTIPTPVSFVYNGVTYLTSSFFINDNTTTTASLTFPDSSLLNAEEVDIQGNNLFQLGELGDSAWCIQYAGRSVWGRVRNKVQNFINLSFDGGYNPNLGGNITPLGWSLDSSNLSNSLPTLLVSPVFGNSYYIENQTVSSQPVLGMITQSAYQDYNGVAILQSNTPYSVRVTCRTPSSAIVGALNIDLTEYNSGTGYGQTLGSYLLPTGDMTSNMVTYSGTLLTSDTLTIPSNLLLRVWASSLGKEGDIEIDRIEIYPTLAPVNLTGLTISYQDDWESFDLITGGNDTNTVNAEPANGGFVMDSLLYIVKENSLGYLNDTPNQEPSGWNPFKEVSKVAGACGINAYDSITEKWAIMANQNGLYGFTGGSPVQLQLEIPDIWQAINWDAAESIVVRNDSANHRIFIACPMPTPNPYLPDPTTGGVVSVDVTSGGTYTFTLEHGLVPPTVIFSGNGVGAEGTAILNYNAPLGNYYVGSVNITSPGVYSGPVTVTFEDGTGSGAAGTVTLGDPNPTENNVVIFLNYDGIGTIEELINGSAIHVTIVGKIAIHDIKRKWSLWTVPTPYMALCKRNELDSTMLICNGIGSSKIYRLGDYTAGNDDGVSFTSSYCTYGFVDQAKAQQVPMFGLFNKTFVYWDALITGKDSDAADAIPASMTFYQNNLNAPYPFVVPGGLPDLSDPCPNDLEGNLDEYCQRLFMELKTKGGYWNLSRFTLIGKADAWAPLRGVSGGI